MKILVLAFTNLARDPRVDRQLEWLSGAHQVTAVGIGASRVGGVRSVVVAVGRPRPVERVRKALRLLMRRYERAYWSDPRVSGTLTALGDTGPWDLVISNDALTLPLALRLARGAGVLFDAHEYEPAQYEDRLAFRLFYRDYKRYLCAEYIPQVDVMTTVSPGIRVEYREDTGVDAEVITNAPEYEPLDPTPVDPDRIHLVHHGGAIPSRRLETLIEMMQAVDARFVLNLVLVPGSTRYLKRLRQLAFSLDTVRFWDPVEVREIPSFLNQFDVGVHFLPPTNTNHRLALPNKLFEFVQARLAVVVGPSPAMEDLVTSHGLGRVAAGFSAADAAEAINALDAAAIARHKRAADAAASDFSARSNRRRFMGLIDQAARR